MRPDQIIMILVILAVAFVLGMLVLRRTGHARGRGWIYFAIIVIVAIGAIAMLWPMFGLQPQV